MLLSIASLALTFTGAAGSNWLRFHPVFGHASLAARLAEPGLEWFAQTLPGSLFIAIAILVVVGFLEDRPIPLGETLMAGLRWTGPLLLVQGLYLAGVLLGCVLLVVPGIVVGLMWFFASSVLVVERVGVVEAFRRSRALSKGHRWMLFALMIGYLVVVFLLEKVLLMATSGASTGFLQAAGQPLNSYLVIPMLGAVTGLLSTVFTVALYVQLTRTRMSRADVTAEVFA